MSEETWEETDLESINIGDYLKCITIENISQGKEYNYEVKGCLVCKATKLYQCRVETAQGEIVALGYNVSEMGEILVYKLLIL